MEFFLDTASIAEIKKWKKLDVVNGVTTNPTLLSKEGNEPLEQLKEITKLVQGPVSAQVTTKDHQGMIIQGKALQNISKNILVKVPSTIQGYLAAKELSENGVNINITLNFNAAQIIPFCQIPVSYVSLIIGRVGDFGIIMDNKTRISQARIVIDKLNSSTKLLAASIRNPEQLSQAIVEGAHTITVPPSTWELVYNNPLTISGENDFFTAWNQLPEKIREKYEKLSL